MAQPSYPSRAQRRLNGDDVCGMKIIAPIFDQCGKLKVNETQTSNWQTSRVPNANHTWSTRTPEQLSADTLRPCNVQPSSAPIELVITNLDACVGDLRTTLSNYFKQFMSAFSVTITYHENKPIAIVKVGTRYDAEHLISKLHHQKIGSRRMSVSYARGKSLDVSGLKEHVIYMLLETANKSMPVYMLLNLLEQKYLMKVSFSEVSKLRDVCQIVDANGERLICLTDKIRGTSLVNLQKPQQLHYCCVHCPNGISTWMLEAYDLPCIRVPLAELAIIIGKMLDSHLGALPLMSFMLCYQQEFGDSLALDNVHGVPLEHLVTCIPSVRLKCDGVKNMAKYIVWEYACAVEDGEPFKSSTTSPLASNISQLKRELIDLLKSSPKCQILLGKFVPAYHHHFGRQLRVASYGYTKLDDLLHSPHVAHVIQIIGEGTNRVLTLTHIAQKRRFTADLLRILKSQVSKQISLSELPAIYEKMHQKPFSITEYGVCYVNDLLLEQPENLIKVSPMSINQDYMICIPQRIRTADNIFRTRQFANEVIKLLSHSPNCSMHFDKFVPHYHHHFGHQCKVSEYGFTKLFEVFEAIPDVAKVEALPNGQRIICLTAFAGLQLLGTRIAELICKSATMSLACDQLEAAYFHEFKTHINPEAYNCANVSEVLPKLKDFVTVNYGGKWLVLADNDAEMTLLLRVWSLLVQPPHQSDANVLMESYSSRFKSNITLDQLEFMTHIILTREADGQVMVYLIPEFAKAAKIYNLLQVNGGQVTLNMLESLYQSSNNQLLPIANESGYEKFLRDFAFLIRLGSTRRHATVSLNPKLAELGLPIANAPDSSVTSKVKWPSLSLASTYNFAKNYLKWSPPKPDTPPSGMASMEWQQQSPSKSFEKLEFSIHLPEPVTPKIAPQALNFISPAKCLLPAHPMGALLFDYQAPDPSELPMPHKLIRSMNQSGKKRLVLSGDRDSECSMTIGIPSDDSSDSGVNMSNSSLYKDAELDSSEEQSCAQDQRKNWKTLF